MMEVTEREDIIAKLGHRTAVLAELRARRQECIEQYRRDLLVGAVAGEPPTPETIKKADRRRFLAVTPIEKQIYKLTQEIDQELKRLYGKVVS